MDETKGPDKDTDFELEVENGGHLLIGVREQQREGDGEGDTRNWRRVIRETRTGLRLAFSCQFPAQVRHTENHIQIRSRFFPPHVSQSPGAANCLPLPAVGLCALGGRYHCANHGHVPA